MGVGGRRRVGKPNAACRRGRRRARDGDRRAKKTASGDPEATTFFLGQSYVGHNCLGRNRRRRNFIVMPIVMAIEAIETQR